MVVELTVAMAVFGGALAVYVILKLLVHFLVPVSFLSELKQRVLWFLCRRSTVWLLTAIAATGLCLSLFVATVTIETLPDPLGAAILSLKSGESPASVPMHMGRNWVVTRPLGRSHELRFTGYETPPPIISFPWRGIRINASSEMKPIVFVRLVPDHTLSRSVIVGVGFEWTLTVSEIEAQSPPKEIFKTRFSGQPIMLGDDREYRPEETGLNVQDEFPDPSCPVRSGVTIMIQIRDQHDTLRSEATLTPTGSVTRIEMKSRK